MGGCGWYVRGRERRRRRARLQDLEVGQALSLGLRLAPDLAEVDGA